MQHASDAHQASEKAGGPSGLLGQIGELVISAKGLVAAIGTLVVLAGMYFNGDQPSTPSPDSKASMGPALPEAQGQVGWAIVGNYVTGKLTNPLIKIELAIPQVDESCEALDKFSVFKDHPADQHGGKILLGDVHKGDRIEVLDMRRDNEKGAPYWVKLRAVLHAH